MHQLITISALLKSLRKRFLVFLVVLFLGEPGFTQRRADSLRNLLATETIDTNKVRLMWQLASALNVSKPDTALVLAQNALYLARRHNYLEGESRALGILANTFRVIGNYSRALDLNLQKLKLEEKRSIPGNLASVLMNIGIVYVYQEECQKALEYYSKADSVIRKYDVQNLKYNIALNTGDAYDKLGIPDSAFLYFYLSLGIAKARDDVGLIGTSMTGLGHTYQKLGRFDESLSNYRTAIRLLKEAEDDEVFCEAALGLARLFQKMGMPDSAAKYAEYSLATAKKGFLAWEYEAVRFLTGLFMELKNIEKAFGYSEMARQLNDTLNSKVKIRELQILSSNEQYRQREMEETKRIAAKKRFKQLQLLLVGMFIPGFFLITLLLSVSRIHVRFIRALGILSLLFFFEYLTLWLHPTVAELTNHTPVYEILIFVAVASLLIPMHHKVEHWLIHRLIRHRVKHESDTNKKNHPPEQNHDTIQTDE
jgi:tetratricopeptide (TPR) repeat protein